MPSFAMLLLAGALVGCGVYLVLERTLTRIFIGLSLMTNGINVLILAMAGPAGLPPLLGGGGGSIVDPLPQAMILTSIVLSLGTTAFGLALAYRSWRLAGHDEVIDDIEDSRLQRRVERLRFAARGAGEQSGATGAEDPGIDYDQDGPGDDPLPGARGGRP